MNSFLQNAKAELSKTGEKINLNGEDYLVIKASAKSITKLNLKARLEGEAYLKEQESDLKKQILRKSEKDEIRKGYEGKVGEGELDDVMGGLKTHYDLQLLIFITNYQSSNIYTEVVKKLDGSNIYENEEYRIAINQSIESNPDQVEIIKGALDRLEKKRIQSLKKSSKGGK